MNNTPIQGLSELQEHLAELVSDPSLPLNTALFDRVELQLTDDNIPSLLPGLAPTIATILRTTTQDASSCFFLAIRLAAVLNFSQALSMADPPTLIGALRSSILPANNLALSILHKAAESTVHIQVLSTMPDVFQEIVRCWLGADNVGVTEHAARVIGDVLDTDCPIEGGIQPTLPNGNPPAYPPRHYGDGVLWNMFLRQRATALIIRSYCSPSPNRTAREVSYSQGRLLRLLPRLAAISPRHVYTTDFADLFPAPEPASPGILPWAALSMIDRNDMLLRLNLFEFFERLVSISRVSTRRTPDADRWLAEVIRASVSQDDEVEGVLLNLPSSTIEEEAEPLRTYIARLLGPVV